jgi:transformation/transcription domain-associated protein
MAASKKQAAAVAAARAMGAGNASVPGVDPSRRSDSDHSMSNVGAAGNSAQPTSQPGHDVAHGAPVPGVTDGTQPYPVRQASDHVEEVLQILKTAFPLLILSMETLVEHINQRFKATPEEEIYRLVCMLLQDAVQVSPYCEHLHCSY